MGKTFTRIRRSLAEVSGQSTYSATKEKLIDIKDWFYEQLVSKPRRFKESVEKVIGWLPIIWKNHDWDSHYLFEVMRYKLSRMEKCIRVHGHATCSKRTANEIKTAKLLLDRICKNDYIGNATDPLDKEYGGWTFDWSNRTLEKKYKRPLTKKQTHYYEKAISRAYKHSDYMEKQDIEYVLKFINKHHKKWWD